MAAVDEMNLILTQTPHVEKVQQAEQQNPEQTQRHAAIQEAEEHRKRSETVQHTDNTKEIKSVDDEKSEKKRSREQQDMEMKTEEIEKEELPPEKDAKTGKIVDVLI
ncbi:MAG: hypothetical protein JRG97_03120 [Deltaproteobacteria bacterium]|nr:hypothetical protein [Deltaproteobacteria bacterium]MBW2140048.1 hypothetical protein [Deltaproteobacteria bacterium]MBW2322086.1 hypothetical protein [Deltaproteobacteria bacterium]